MKDASCVVVGGGDIGIVALRTSLVPYGGTCAFKQAVIADEIGLLGESAKIRSILGTLELFLWSFLELFVAPGSRCRG